MLLRTQRPDIPQALVGAAAIGLLYLLLGWLMAGCRPYDAAWRTTAAVREAATLTDHAIARAAKHRATACKEQGGDWRACVRSSKEWAAVTGWRKWGVPAINSALVSTVAALQIAERTGQEHIDWIAILRPAACALARVMRQWAPMMGPAKEPVSLAVAAIGGVCK